MAASDVHAFPIRNKPYRISGIRINSSVTGNPITGGLTGVGVGPNVQLSQDGGSWVNAAGLFHETDTSGYGYIDLSSAEMNFYSITVRVAPTNPNAVEWSVTIITDGSGGRIQ